MIIKLFLIIFSMSLYASELKMEIIGQPKKVLPGVPLREYMLIKIMNEGKKDLKFYYNPCTWVRLEVKGSVSYYEEELPVAQKTPFSKHQVIKAGKEVICGFRDIVFIEEGKVKVKAIFDSNKIKKLAPAEYWKDLWIGRIESEEIEIDIKFESLIDRELFERYGNGREGYFNILNGKSEEILEKYPTSTYAGWAFFNANWKGVVHIGDFRDKKYIERLKENVLKIAKGINYKEIAKEHGGDMFKEEIFEENVRNMERAENFCEGFVKENPNFSFSGYILAVGGMNALFLGKISQACEMLNNSLKLGWNKPYIGENFKKTIKEVLSILEGQGYCK